MKIINEFKAFISRGNVMDMAVGVIIGGAFTAIVNSLVNSIFMPLLSLITGGLDFSHWVITIGEGEKAAVIAYGAFISAIINFLLVAIVIFLLIKAINKLHKKKEEAPAAEPTKCPFCLQAVADEATRCPHCTSMLPEKAE